MNSLEKKIKQELSPYTGPFLICCSGGPDSVFLVHMLAKQSKKGNHHVVYFNHHLRSEEIDKEIETVQKLCLQLGFTCHIDSLKITIKNQATYRDARIKKIKKLCKKLTLSNVLLGHHLNDDIETLLMQLFKGATTNFRGVPKKTTLDNITMIHPLLGISKKEIITYLSKNNINYCIDSSNLTDQYQRNKCRIALEKLYEVFKPSNQQLNQTLSTLKKNELSLLKKAHAIKKTTKDKNIWIKKSDLEKETSPELLLKVWIENNLDQYVNQDDLSKIKKGLLKATLSTIPLQNITVLIDYKWVFISTEKNHKGFKKITLKKNRCTQTILGDFCITLLKKETNSNRERLCLSEKDFKTLTIDTIANCPLKIPSQKKTLRKCTISPIEQMDYPIIFTEANILWIPNAYVKKNKGHVIITFSN